MTETPRLDAYHFYEQEWKSYEALREAFEWQLPDRFNVADYCVDRWADEDATSERVALYATDDDGWSEAVSYGELADRAARFAGALRAVGVGRGDRVGICLPQRPETVVAHLATWRVGGVTVPLSTRFGPQALGYRLEDCSVTAAVIDESRYEAFDEARPIGDGLDAVFVRADVGDEEDGATARQTKTTGDPTSHSIAGATESATPVTEAVDTSLDDDAMIIYTSGTTGSPKGVRHTHSLLLGHLPSVVTTFFNLDPREREVFYTPVEWAWVGPIWALVLPALFYGRSIVAHDGEGPFEAERAFQLVEQYEVTRMLGPTTMWRMLQDVERPADRYDLDSVQVLVGAGESLGDSVVDWIDETFGGAAVHEGYGQTEAMDLVMDCSALFPPRQGKMGRPTPGVEVTVLDPDRLEPVEPGDVGEIAVWYGDGHPLCFEEYWNKPEKTAEKVRNGWLLTEDLGTVDENGYVAFVGRTDDVILCSGYRIGPEEVEESLATHDSVRAAGVIGVPDEDHGEVPKAFVELVATQEPSNELAETLKSYVKSQLAMYEYPRLIEFVDELPTTGSGKIQRSALREREGL